MSNSPWRKTACILCYANCGLEVQTEGARITRVRGDRDHPRSAGYLCQKAAKIDHYQDSGGRLSTPLRRRADGSFEPVDWETALDEIAERMLGIRAQHGARALGHYGGGGQGNHSGGGYGITMMRAFGATEFYSALAQEKSGRFWVNGRMFGAQNCNHTAQMEDTALLIAWGSSIWQAQCEPGARSHLKEAAHAAERRIIVVDPVRTRDAELADLHLQLKPGTDTYLFSAMLKLLLDAGGLDESFIDEHTSGWEAVRPVIAQIPVTAWIEQTGLGAEEVRRAVEMIMAAPSMTLRTELGIEMGRNSTLNSYLGNLLFLLTGNFGRPGTQAIHTWLQPLLGNSRGARSLVTGQEQIMGLYPPNRLAAEILSEAPERLRALLVDSANPANTAANSAATEEALKALDLLVVVDVAMTETAALADYVLPAASQYEKWEFTYFTFSFPVNYFHVRQPLFEPYAETRVEAAIYAELARRLGLLPASEQLAALTALAADDRSAFAEGLRALFGQEPAFAAVAPLILYLTLGETLPGGAASTVILWPACQRLAARSPQAVQRALNSEAEGAALAEILFDRLIESPSGTPFSVNEFEDVWELLGYRDRRVRLEIPEMLEWLRGLDPAADKPDPDYPFVVSLGQRRQYNANQIIRTPRWRGKDTEGSLRVHPSDLERLGVSDQGWITVETATGALTARAEADATLQVGYATLPHGYGMRHRLSDGTQVTVGPRINQLSASDDCDPIGATPYHKNVAARLRRASDDESGMCETSAALIRSAMA